MSKPATKIEAPKWLLERDGITQRQWKSKKRDDLRDLIIAFGRYRCGCAFCPGTVGEVGQIGQLLQTLKKSHSIKEWGR